MLRRILPVLLGVVLLISSCTNTGSSATATSPTPSPAATETASPVAQATGADAQFANLPRLDGEATVEMTVKGAKITIKVDGKNAPITAGNFVDLVNRKVYDGLMFHRVIREPQPFVAQGGDPTSKDTSVPPTQLGAGSFVDPVTSQPRYIPLEIKPEGSDQPIYSKTFAEAQVTQPPVLRHNRGALAMARSQFPDSASAQFYIALGDLGFLDGNYAVFGQVTSGMEVVDQIQIGDRIESVTVTSGLENLKNGGQ
jgi:peptidyl-prolyl cis-trans isomerase B (cyclophilin B)